MATVKHTVGPRELLNTYREPPRFAFGAFCAYVRAMSRDAILKLRLTSSLKSALEKKAKSRDQSVSDYVRQQILDSLIVRSPLDVYPEAEARTAGMVEERPHDLPKLTPRRRA